MRLPCIQTCLKTLTLDEIASTLREIRGSVVPQEPGLFSSPIWSQISERDFHSCFCIPQVYVSLDFGVVCKVITKYIKKHYGLCNITVAQSFPYVYLHIILKSGLSHLSSITKSHLL